MPLTSWTGWTKWNGTIKQTLDDAQKAAAGGSSIAEFRKTAGPGPHGVLDVVALGEKAKAGGCWVLSGEELHHHFGSKVPTKKAIEGGIDGFLSKLGTGESVAVTAWTRGTPTAVLFAGKDKR